MAVAFLSLTLSNTLMLPPYEGFDENGHYSYISFLADRHGIPDFRSTPFDFASSENADHMPRRYSATPPFEKNGGKTYADFFNRMPDLERAEIAVRFWNPPRQPAEYAPQEDTTNWIGQHPPLYYALMTLPYRAERWLSPGGRLLLLRLCSVALACGSFVFWFLSLRLFESPVARRMILLGGIAVLFFPSCWFDLGRLGNDSLVALLSSSLFYFALCAYKNHHRRLRDHLAIAIVLGLGLLTKAFFIPFYLGMVAWLLLTLPTPINPGRLLKAWKAGRKSLPDRSPAAQTSNETEIRPGGSDSFSPPLMPWSAAILRAAVVVAIPLLFASPWYWFCWQRYGSPLVTSESYAWTRPGARMLADTMTTTQILLGTAKMAGTFGKSFIWAGTWSLVMQPWWHYALGLGLILLAAVNMQRCLWKNADADSHRLL